MPNDTIQKNGYDFTVHTLPYEGEGIGQELAEKLTVVTHTGTSRTENSHACCQRFLPKHPELRMSSEHSSVDAYSLIIHKNKLKTFSHIHSCLCLCSFHAICEYTCSDSLTLPPKHAFFIAPTRIHSHATFAAPGARTQCRSTVGGTGL